MTLDQLNQLDDQKLKEALERCCGSSKWQKALSDMKPFDSLKDLQDKADKAWDQCGREDALEAFAHHPKIGDRQTLEKKFATTKDWAGKEQSGVEQATKEVIDRLMEGNRVYENKFGYIFIVFATGKSGREMLEILESRLHNDAAKELAIAMKEQHKITKLRLNKLLPMSQITTHVLDTATGMPAEGLKISLQRPGKGEEVWENITSGITNSDGRIVNFLDDDLVLAPGIYRMLFDTGAYFASQEIKGFYPFVPVVFEIHDSEHYHVPLLLSPFGYSTYRGS